MKTYTTVSGDMWDSIAYKAMGSVNYTSDLIRLNQQYVGIYRFPAGITLDLPEPRAEIDDRLPPWKQVDL